VSGRAFFDADEVCLDQRPEQRSCARRGPRWEAASLTLRVTEWRCAACGLRPSRPAQLQAAHLLAVAEIEREFDPLVAVATLDDRRNLAALCTSCHRAFDYLLVGVRDARRLDDRERERLWRRVERHLPAFTDLLLRRARYRRQLQREVGTCSTAPAR
jgi:hypothetical protein